MLAKPIQDRGSMWGLFHRASLPCFYCTSGCSVQKYNSSIAPIESEMACSEDLTRHVHPFWLCSLRRSSDHHLAWGVGSQPIHTDADIYGTYMGGPVQIHPTHKFTNHPRFIPNDSIRVGGAMSMTNDFRCLPFLMINSSRTYGTRCTSYCSTKVVSTQSAARTP